MWPFLRRNRQHGDQGHRPLSQQSTRQRPMRFAEIVQGMGDFSDLQVHDKALKFWLPEPAAEALMELSALDGESMSEMLRRYFAQHCYGVYAFQVMNQVIPWLFKDPDQTQVRFCIDEESVPPGKKRVDTYWVPELGKNVMPIKVWIPSRMHGDLQILANHVGIKLSQYVREIVISRLLGHGTLPKRPEMLAAEPLPSTEDWCDDRKVPMRQVTEEQWWQSPDGQVITEWVDR